MSEQTQTYELYLAVPEKENLRGFYGFSAIRLFPTRELADLFVQRKNAANCEGQMRVVPIALTQQVPQVIDTYHATWTYASEQLDVRRATPQWSDDSEFQSKPDPSYGQFGMASGPPDYSRSSGARVVRDCTKDARIESSAPTEAGAIMPILDHLKYAKADSKIISKVEKELESRKKPPTTPSART